jgi:CDP-2,3-bis-(O-geranylgeranyl)-sn-glycerol synthase
MFEHILFVLWFFAPAGLANAAPVFATRIPLLNKLAMPVDGGKTFRGKRIFGDHKTIRGFVSGILLSTTIICLQVLLFRNVQWFRQVSLYVDYSKSGIYLLGPLFGFGALFGDAIKSFFKRQFNVPSGESWIPFDQVDYIIGGILFSIPVVLLHLNDIFLLFLVWIVIHPISTFIGWLLGLKDKPI